MHCNQVFSFSFFLLLCLLPLLFFLLHHHHHLFSFELLYIFFPYFYYILNICFYIVSPSLTFLNCSCNLLSSFSLCAKYILDFANYSFLFPSQSFPCFCFCLPSILASFLFIIYPCVSSTLLVHIISSVLLSLFRLFL